MTEQECGELLARAVLNLERFASYTLDGKDQLAVDLVRKIALNTEIVGGIWELLAKEGQT